MQWVDGGAIILGVPEAVAALVSALSDTSTSVTLVNLNRSARRTVIMQGGGYGEHQLIDVTLNGKRTSIDSPFVTVQLEPGAGQTLELTMKPYANAPTSLHPWHRKPYKLSSLKPLNLPP